MAKAMTSHGSVVTFNGPVEVGVRLVHLLLALYPKHLGLDSLVTLDYMVVHTADVGGPESLHPRLPYQSTEILIRRKLLESGVLLMSSRGLIERIVSYDGIAYCAGDAAETFVSALEARYFRALRERAQWVADTFGELDQQALQQFRDSLSDQWITEFQNIERSLGADS